MSSRMLMQSRTARSPRCSWLFLQTVSGLVSVPEESCDLNPQRTCRLTTRLVPALEPVQQCNTVPKQTCQYKFSKPKVTKKPLMTKWCLDESLDEAEAQKNDENEINRASANILPSRPALDNFIEDGPNPDYESDIADIELNYFDNSEDELLEEEVEPISENFPSIASFLEYLDETDNEVEAETIRPEEKIETEETTITSTETVVEGQGTGQGTVLVAGRREERVLEPALTSSLQFLRVEDNLYDDILSPPQLDASREIIGPRMPDDERINQALFQTTF